VLLVTLSLAAGALADMPMPERYQRLKSGADTMLPGTSLSLVSSEQKGEVSAEVTGVLPYPFTAAAPALAKAENWCQFMPLHFNIKACTYEQQHGNEVLTLYSGRKTYQAPQDSYTLAYRVEARDLSDEQMALSLYAPSGPVGTRDYRIEVQALKVKEGTLLHIRSSYRSSMTSALLARTYLSTLGRDKIGFTRIEQNGVMQPVQGVRGVIERNVIRYQLAIDTFLNTQALPATARREAALARWFRLNESHPDELHEMGQSEYLTIKRHEWQNQLRLQQYVNEQHHLAVLQ